MKADHEELTPPAVVESGIRISLISNEGEFGYEAGIKNLREYVKHKRRDGDAFAFTVESYDGEVECVMRKSDLYVKPRGIEEDNLTYDKSDITFGKLSSVEPKKRMDALGMVIAEAVRFQPMAEYTAGKIKTNNTTLKHSEQLKTPRGGLLYYQQRGGERKPLRAGDCPNLWSASTKGTQFFEIYYEKDREVIKETNVNQIVKIGYKSQKKLMPKRRKIKATKAPDLKKLQAMARDCDATNITASHTPPRSQGAHKLDIQQ